LDSTTKLDLSQFYGTENYYRTNPIFAKDMVHTDGVKYFADNAGNGAYWFLTLSPLKHFHCSRKSHFWLSNWQLPMAVPISVLKMVITGLSNKSILSILTALMGSISSS